MTWVALALVLSLVYRANAWPFRTIREHINSGFRWEAPSWKEALLTEDPSTEQVLTVEEWHIQHSEASNPGKVSARMAASAKPRLQRQPMEGDSILPDEHAGNRLPGCNLTVLVFGQVSDNLDSLSFLFPINALRNHAALLVRTPLAAMVDVDLVLNQGFARSLLLNRSYAERLVQQAAEGNLLIPPAMETKRCAEPQCRDGVLEGLVAARGPRGVMKALFRGGSLDTFHCDRATHYNVDFRRWLRAKKFTSYEVPYAPVSEPWYIGHRALLPWYDVRFKGFGFNKQMQVQCNTGLAVRGQLHPAQAQARQTGQERSCQATPVRAKHTLLFGCDCSAQWLAQLSNVSQRRAQQQECVDDDAGVQVAYAAGNMGMRLMVLADAWLIHLPHQTTIAARLFSQGGQFNSYVQGSSAQGMSMEEARTHREALLHAASQHSSPGLQLPHDREKQPAAAPSHRTLLTPTSLATAQAQQPWQISASSSTVRLTGRGTAGQQQDLAATAGRAITQSQEVMIGQQQGGQASQLELQAQQLYLHMWELGHVCMEQSPLPDYTPVLSPSSIRLLRMLPWWTPFSSRWAIGQPSPADLKVDPPALPAYKREELLENKKKLQMCTSLPYNNGKPGKASARCAEQDGRHSSHRGRVCGLVTRKL
ncbi:hypothetical protein QJQ45_017133 [Haematococcus lacustris]|nr:hypothetical protein QJQ45_017133 [Haematococcus lacustris]